MNEERLGNRLGLVSNCWKFQLDAGESLRHLVRRAVNEGFRFVELRQGCLGEFEEPATRLPNAESLASLTREFPELTFNLAVELPIFSRPIDTASRDIRTKLKATHALADDRRPAHLRIVDLVSKTVPVTGSENSLPSDFVFEDVITSISKLQKELSLGVLSIEHSFQSWSGFARLFEVARSQAGSSEAANTLLKLCYDPCNLWLTGEGGSASEITQSVPVDWLAMVHLKQRIDGSVSTRLEPGEVDWWQHLTTFWHAGYSGPFLFETAPTEDVWESLAVSRRYFTELTSELPSRFGD